MRTLKLATALAVASLSLMTPSVAMAYPPLPTHNPCGAGNCWQFHEYVYSACSGCTTTGTGWTSTVPSSWSVPQDGYHQDLMGEGVWLINTNNGGQSTEAGYVSGWWPYSSPPEWLGGLNPYGTDDNDPGLSYEHHGAASLTPGASVAAWVYSTGSTAQVDQSGQLFWSYNSFASIPLTRFNFAQGEVHATNCDGNGNNCNPHPWLNNCNPGETFQLEWQAPSGTGSFWGNTQPGSYGPYWVQANTSNYKNGGC